MSTSQLTTFFIGKDRYGIEVTCVQEVTGQPQVVSVPLAPDFVLGVINLRGQITTALALHTLFGHAAVVETGERMSVVCKIDGSLVSLVVDSIGDVLEVESRQFEGTPETIRPGIRRFLKGIYKLNDGLLSVIDLEKLSQELASESEPDSKAA